MKTIACLTSVVLLGALSVACSGPADDSAGSSAAATANTAGKICTPKQAATAYDKMIRQPIVPPRQFAGVDFAGDANWDGLTFAGAEKTLCDGAEVAESVNGDDTLVNAGFGPNQEVIVEYAKSTGKIDFYQLNQGYLGTLDFKSRATALGDPTKPNPFGQHTYKIGVGIDILRDGKPWQLDWANFDSQSTELFDALMYTFAPELNSTQTSCRAAATCLARKMSDNEAIFGVRPLGIYFHVNTQTHPNQPDYIYGFFVKTTPFSFAEMTLKLDAEGPIASAKSIGDRKVDCTMKLGTTFQSFKESCVDVMTDPQINAATEKKALGAARVANGTYTLDVAGPHLNFDATAPAGGAKATELVLDIRSNGKVTNEWVNGANTLVATNAIYAEYGRLVQQFLGGQFAIGDARCLLPAGADPTTWKPAQGCTGIEQMITPSTGQGMGFSTVLRPGTPFGLFCADPGVFAQCGDGALGASGAIWDATRRQVVAVLGGGNEGALPKGANDTLTYVHLWTKALVKYLRAAPQSPTDLSNPAFDGLLPADGDIQLSIVPGGATKVSYLDKLDIEVFPQSGIVQSIVFH